MARSTMATRGIAPTPGKQAAFIEMLADYEAYDPENAESYLPAKADFAAYVQSLLDQEHGLNLPNGWAPTTHRWLVAPDGAIVGVTRFRHHIDTPFLFNEGGHIGYDIAPSHRRKGYGHIALQVALTETKSRGLDRVLLVTGEDNIASRAIIERQGGVLESIGYSEFWREQLCRYWINLPNLA